MILRVEHVVGVVTIEGDAAVGEADGGDAGECGNFVGDFLLLVDDVRFGLVVGNLRIQGCRSGRSGRESGEVKPVSTCMRAWKLCGS